MDTTLVIIGVALLAAALAGTLGFVLGGQRARSAGDSAHAEAEAGRVRIAALERDAQMLRAEIDARVQDERERGDQRVAEGRQLGEAALATERQRGDQRVAEVRREAAQRADELRADRKRLADEFDALSRRALEANTTAFLQQAEERLKRSQSEGAAELQKRQDAVQQLIEPIQKTLDTVKTEMTTTERSRVEAHAALSEQLQIMRRSSEALGSETRNLVNALRAPQVRGRWGELQLRRVVEASGMLNHVDFDEQMHHTTDDGAMRPDLVVHLAGDKRVVVDAKVAFSGYLEAMEATDDAVRARRLQAHARHLRRHIDDLGAKEYWDVVAGSPEFVVMFVPAEPFLAAALDEDATLYEYAFERNVVIATPATLIALLRTVGHAWRQDQLAEEAQQIFTVGKELHKRLGTLGAHLARLGKSLNGTVDAYNRFAGSLDRNVVTQARRFSALQGLDDVLADAVPVEALAIAPQKADLYAAPAIDAAAPGAASGTGAGGSEGAEDPVPDAGTGDRASNAGGADRASDAGARADFGSDADAEADERYASADLDAIADRLQ